MNVNGDLLYFPVLYFNVEILKTLHIFTITGNLEVMKHFEDRITFKSYWIDLIWFELIWIQDRSGRKGFYSIY